MTTTAAVHRGRSERGERGGLKQAEQAVRAANEGTYRVKPMPSQLVSVRMVHLYLSPSPFTLKPKPPYAFRSSEGVKFFVRTCSTLLSFECKVTSVLPSTTTSITAAANAWSAAADSLQEAALKAAMYKPEGQYVVLPDLF